MEISLFAASDASRVAKGNENRDIRITIYAENNLDEIYLAAVVVPTEIWRVEISGVACVYAHGADRIRR